MEDGSVADTIELGEYRKIVWEITPSYWRKNLICCDVEIQASDEMDFMYGLTPMRTIHYLSKHYRWFCDDIASCIVMIKYIIDSWHNYQIAEHRFKIIRRLIPSSCQV